MRGRNSRTDEGGPRSSRRARFLRILGLSIFLGVVFSLHIVPRPAPPYLFPLPKNETSSLDLELSKDRARVAELESSPLPHDVRVIGEEYRRESSFNLRGIEAPELTRDVRSLLAAGRGEELLRLRALQCELFMNALEKQLFSAPPSSELIELGGDFWRVALDSWISGDAFLLSSDELRVLFRIRWSKLAGVLADRTLGISLGELRVYYSAMLRHPPGALGKGPEVLARLRDGVVYDAARTDPEYPLGLASGLNLQLLGQPDLARVAFEAEARAGRPAAKSLRLAHHRLAVAAP